MKGDVPEDGLPMTVATCTPTGRPSARVRVPSSRRCGVYWLQLAGGLNLLRVCVERNWQMVLLKGVQTSGFIFFSNYQSRKVLTRDVAAPSAASSHEPSREGPACRVGSLLPTRSLPSCCTSRSCSGKCAWRDALSG